MKFTWDEAKNRVNIRKHEFDFVDAEKVFGGPMLIEEDPGQYGERRMVGIGILEGRVTVVVVYTEPDSQTTRIISMRKANRYEKDCFAEAIKN